jgi:hypothetical protein
MPENVPIEFDPESSLLSGFAFAGAEPPTKRFT